MRILFTGSSSFTGYWFINHLVNSGNKVTAIFTKNSKDDYSGVRKLRVEKIIDKAVSFFDVSFGSEKFLEIIASEKFDLICHHGADVTNYKSLDFDVCTAFNKNTFNIVKVLELMRESNSKLVLTGSVFEGNEGFGKNNTLPFSPYGLSKQFTSEAFNYYCNLLGVPVGKFVISNPFGPFEEERFTTYLVKSWLRGEKPVIKTPLYIRDNIHISLLAFCYIKFCNEFSNSNIQYYKINPSGYVESQGQFTKRFAEEISKRLNITPAFELLKQTEFAEPLVRINNDPAAELFKDWSESEAWDQLAEYYKLFFMQNE